MKIHYNHCAGSDFSANSKSLKPWHSLILKISGLNGEFQRSMSGSKLQTRPSTKKLFFGEFDQDIFTLVPPLQGVSIDSVIVLI